MGLKFRKNYQHRLKIDYLVTIKFAWNIRFCTDFRVNKFQIMKGVIRVSTNGVQFNFVQFYRTFRKHPERVIPT